MTSYDVVTMGETMMRLTPPDLLRIEQTLSFDIHVGGSESNTAVGLSRLGLDVAWISRLPDSLLGKYVRNRVQQYGVDTRHVAWSATDRLGTYFLELGTPPRISQIIYDRADSAMSRMQPEELPQDLFVEGNAKLLHVTGITLAIGEGSMASAHEAVKRAKAAGWMVGFDTNYRSKLWTGDEAAAGCDYCMSQADIIFCPMGDYRVMYGDDSPQDAISKLAEKYPNKIIVVTMGSDGSMARTANGEIFTQAATKVEAIGRIGAGDAFSAGFLYGYLTYDDVGIALQWASAMAAYKFTIHGDVPVVDREEIAAIVAGQSGGLRR